MIVWKCRLIAGAVLAIAATICWSAAAGQAIRDAGGNAPEPLASVSSEIVAFSGSAEHFWSLNQQKVIAGDGEAGDGFGYSVAVSGNTALVGAPYVSVGGNANQGAVYVFVTDGVTWTQQAKLVAPDGAVADFFGASVAIHGDTALVGAFGVDVTPFGSEGAAYVYERIGSTWLLQAKLLPNDSRQWDKFGIAVSIFGDVALIGAPAGGLGERGPPGQAYVFVRQGASWAQEATLRPNDSTNGDLFGGAVSVSGGAALVGATAANSAGIRDRGSAYVFRRGTDGWLQEGQLISDDWSFGDRYSASVSLAGDTALVGAPGDDGVGSVYVYMREAMSWTQRTRLVANSQSGLTTFGGSVSLSAGRALIGAYLPQSAPDTNLSVAYVFAKHGAAWSQLVRLAAADGAGSGFGPSVSLYGESAWVGASRHDVGDNAGQGAAYVWDLDGLFRDGFEALNR
jgi:hypothetical protein